VLPAVSGCALPASAPTARGRPGELVVAGVWDSVRRDLDAEGDERIERQEWHLHQQGKAIEGFCLRSVTWSSLDGRPFLCNGRLRYTEISRHLLRGEAEGLRARLEVTSSWQAPSPCRSDELAMRSCTLTGRGAALLSGYCGHAFELQRRSDAPLPLDLVQRATGSITGVWTWHLRSRDAEGDSKSESEVWQLRQEGERLAGFYDRAVTVRSGDGRRFQCNDETEYMNRARFRISGTLRGPRVHIKELGFTAEPDPCENGYRSLAEYQGTLDRGDGAQDRIVLSWGRGAQILIRRY